MAHRSSSSTVAPRRRTRSRAVAAAIVALLATLLGSTSPAAAAEAADSTEPATALAGTTTLPVTCAAADPSNPMDPSGWVSEIQVTANHPGTVPFAGNFPIQVLATYTFNGPSSFTSLESELHVSQLDRDGEGPGITLQGSGATGGVVTMVTPIAVGIDARGNPGDPMTFVVEDPLVITWHVSARFISWTTVAICTPATPTVVATVSVAPVTSGAPVGDDVTIDIAFANGTRVSWNGLLGTGDVDYVIDPNTGQLGSLAGGGVATNWDGKPFVFAVRASVGPPINGAPNLSIPSIELVLLSPPSGQVAWVPSATPTNGIAMWIDGDGARTVKALAVAHGVLLPSGDPITVSIGIRDLLHR